MSNNNNNNNKNMNTKVKSEDLGKRGNTKLSQIGKSPRLVKPKQTNSTTTSASKPSKSASPKPSKRVKVEKVENNGHPVKNSQDKSPKKRKSSDGALPTQRKRKRVTSKTRQPHVAQS
jgi:hypothetical protein